MRYLLDTNVVSEFQKVDPHPGVVAFLATTHEADMLISVVTIVELHRGTSQMPEGKRRRSLEDWLNRDIHLRFATRMLSVDAETAVVCGHLLGARNLRSDIRRMMDFLLAATAVQHDLTLVTRNVRDFRDTRAQVLNPWEEPIS